MATERVCWLCLEPLDFTVADRRDPRFVVLDEEVPVSKGGDPLDISNVHLVCNRCNGMKGNRILPRGAFAKIRENGGMVGGSRSWLSGNADADGNRLSR